MVRSISTNTDKSSSLLSRRATTTLPALTAGHFALSLKGRLSAASHWIGTATHSAQVRSGLGRIPVSPYVLAAGGSDVYYDFSPRPNVQKRVKLSKAIDPPIANAVAAMIREHKGYSGGRFYVNEFRSIFAPVQEGYDWRYIYIGELDLEKWFPIPEST